MKPCPFLESTKTLATTGKWTGGATYKLPPTHILVLAAAALFFGKVAFILLYLRHRRAK